MRVAAVLLALLAACSHGSPRRQDAGDPGSAAGDSSDVEGNTVVRTVDLNHDGRPDDWKTYRLVNDPAAPEKIHEVLVKRELDTNFDGKPDVTTWFNEDGTRLREAFDLDFDGKVDVVDHYEKGMLVRKEIFHGPGPKPDQIAYYERGKKVRVERDTRGTGAIDTWEYFEDGRLQRIGEDLDGDGIVDRWIKAKAEEPADAAPASAKKK